jgi:squalene-associated FAD-dependent desaturase
MAAALQAADDGHEVVLCERRAMLGGLTWSFTRKGRSFDNGQHVFLRCCAAYRDFLGRLGASDQVHLQKRLRVPVLAPGGRRADIARRALPPPFHLAGSLLGYGHLTVLDRLRLGRAVVPLLRLDLDDPALDQQSFGTWLSRHGQSRRAIEALWELIVLPTLNVAVDEASLSLSAMVFRTGLLDTNDGADIGWSAVPLGELHGTNGARALSNAGVEVRTGVPVSAVRPSGDQWRVAVGAEELVADAVVVAASPGPSADLVPELAPTVSALGSSPIVNVHLVLDRPVTDLPMAAGVDSPVQFVFDRTASAGATFGQVLAVSISGADAQIGRRPEELVRTYHEALGDLFPAAHQARLVDATVTREHRATFRPRPGTAALRPSEETGRPGLYLAGAWCDTGWPATMEGAVRSGQAAAAAVDRHLSGRRAATLTEVAR